MIRSKRPRKTHKEAPGKTPMNKPLRVGLIGAGMVSRHHLIARADKSAGGWEPSR
jgi:hypothetical protein